MIKEDIQIIGDLIEAIGNKINSMTNSERLRLSTELTDEIVALEPQSFRRRLLLTVALKASEGITEGDDQ